MDQLGTILRRQFVALHGQPLLQDLQRQLVDRYPAADLPPLPLPGDLDLQEVLDSTYFFS